MQLRSNASAMTSLSGPDRLLSRIEHAARQGQALVIEYSGARLLLDFSRQQWVDTQRLLPRLLQNRNTGALFDLEEISSREALVQQKGQGRPISEFWWELVYNAFDDTSHEHFNQYYGCRRDDVVHLSCWPNFSRVTVTPACLRMAALFSARPTSVFLASKILEIPLPEVERFYAAAVAAGVVERVNRSDSSAVMAPVPRPHRHQRLLKSLLSHLSRVYSARSA